jgi:hypothetical protein
LDWLAASRVRHSFQATLAAADPGSGLSALMNPWVAHPPKIRNAAAMIAILMAMPPKLIFGFVPVDPSNVPRRIRTSLARLVTSYDSG